MKILRSKFPSSFSFDDANTLFNILSRIRDIGNFARKNIYHKSPIYLLSFMTDRDVYFLDTTNLDTIFLLGFYNKLLGKDLLSSLSNKQKIAYSIGIFFSQGQLPSAYYLKYIFISILKFLIHLLISILDFVFIFIYALFYIGILRNYIKRKANNKTILFEELYTIFYWRKKKYKSIKYYYPDYDKETSRATLVTSFFQYRFNILGFLAINTYDDVHTSLDFISPLQIFSTLIDLARLYLFELTCSPKFTYGTIVSIINSYKYINQRFIALLNYKISADILKVSNLQNIFLWHENQLSHKSLSLGLYKNITKINPCVKVYTYYGSIFSKNALPQFVPTNFELAMGLWCNNNFMHQDINSASEMKSLFSSKKYKISVVRDSLNRTDITYNKKSYLDSITSGRDFTIFSHNDHNEIYIILLRIYKNRSTYHLYEEILSVSNLFVRLHPTVNRVEAINQFYRFYHEYNIKIPRITFIDKAGETIFESIKLSRNCIFGNSSYVNSAISLGSNVIAIRTSYLHNPQIQAININSVNLKVL
ncbi:MULTISPECIES: hypothetical protein [Prochlorococcus]|uniref:hypothetical protein n=1 Tax=Prochlorococcus TaxID=1218 RepID=UPI0005338B86|nr:MULTISPECIES: hypothetical protein [Prochlorococcus]KGG12035.1 hypothetical protein EV05_1238 [Prochlorococcus sp. MIT 0601]